MKNSLRITNTAYPDGTVVMYLHGMTPPPIKNLGSIMKQAAFMAVTGDDIKTPVKLEKHLSKAG
jgi:hypothetical protein